MAAKFEAQSRDRADRNIGYPWRRPPGHVFFQAQHLTSKTSNPTRSTHLSFIPTSPSRTVSPLRRARSPKPQTILSAQLGDRINIYHPRYPNKNRRPFAFPPVGRGGYHHETARVSCAIVTNSAWYGFLSYQSVRREAPSTSGRTGPWLLGATSSAFPMLNVNAFSHV